MFKDFYHLKAEPFSTHPNPGVIFISSTHKEAWYYLLFGIDTQEPFLVLTGEYGMGKTLLCLRLVQVLKKKGKPPVEYISTPGEGYGGILRRIAHRLNISMVPEDEAILQDMIYDYFRAEAHDSRFYLIIDDAHELDTETLTRLKHLSTFNHNGFFPIVMVFVAHPSFLRGLQTPALNSLNQRIKRRYELSRFSFEDMKNYIYFRMLKSGAAGVPVFQEETLQKIYEYSGGVPRLINNICDTCLLIGASRELTTIHPSVVDDARSLVEGSLTGTEATPDIEAKTEAGIEPEAEAASETNTPPEMALASETLLAKETPRPFVTISEDLPDETDGLESDSGLRELDSTNDSGNVGDTHILPPQRSGIASKIGFAALTVVLAIVFMICGAMLSQWFQGAHLTIGSLLPGKPHTNTQPAAAPTESKAAPQASAPISTAQKPPASSPPEKNTTPAPAPTLRDETDSTSPPQTVPGDSTSRTDTTPPTTDKSPSVPAHPAETSSPVMPPTPGKPEAPAETSLKKAETLSAAYPFSIRSSSYQQPSHAVQEMSDFRKKGLLTYLVEINLGDMGNWWRIYVGSYATAAEAQHIKAKFGISHAVVEKTPYACLVGDYASESDIQTAFEKLKQSGFYPYVIQKDKNHFLLYVGAYKNKNEAESLHRELQDKSFKSQIVTR